MKLGPSDRYGTYFRGGTFAAALDVEIDSPSQLAQDLLDGLLEHDRHVALISAVDLGTCLSHAAETAAVFGELTDGKAIAFPDGAHLPPAIILQSGHPLGRAQIRQVRTAVRDAADRTGLALLAGDLEVAEAFGWNVALSEPLHLLIAFEGAVDAAALARVHRRIERKRPFLGRGLHFEDRPIWPAPGRES